MSTVGMEFKTIYDKIILIYNGMNDGHGRSHIDQTLDNCEIFFDEILDYYNETNTEYPTNIELSLDLLKIMMLFHDIGNVESIANFVQTVPRFNPLMIGQMGRTSDSKTVHDVRKNHHIYGSKFFDIFSSNFFFDNISVILSRGYIPEWIINNSFLSTVGKMPEVPTMFNDERKRKKEEDELPFPAGLQQLMPNLFGPGLGLGLGDSEQNISKQNMFSYQFTTIINMEAEKLRHSFFGIVNTIYKQDMVCEGIRYHRASCTNNSPISRIARSLDGFDTAINIVSRAVAYNKAHYRNEGIDSIVKKSIEHIKEKYDPKNGYAANLPLAAINDRYQKELNKLSSFSEDFYRGLASAV